MLFRSAKTKSQLKPVIALVGLCGTGKSEACAFLETQGYTLVYFGGVVMEEVAARGLAITPDNERAVREDLRVQHGMAAMAVMRLPQIRMHLAAGKAVAIDGLYSLAEYELLKTALKTEFGALLKVLALHSPRSLRYSRLAARAHRPLTPQQVDERDMFELKNLDKGGPIALADAVISNDCERATLQARLQDVYLQLLES